MSFEVAEKVADAVLYEGYLLYPYRASSAKNQVRWQFGVVAPRDHCDAGGSESWEMQTECLVEPDPVDEPMLQVRVRFLHLQARAVEEALDPAGERFRPAASLQVDGDEVLPWEEAVEERIDLAPLSVRTLPSTPSSVPLEVAGGHEIEVVRDPAGAVLGRIIRTRWPITAAVHLHAESVDGYLRLRVRIENLSPLDGAVGQVRDAALRHSLLSAHTLLAVSGGQFVSLLDPPPGAREATALLDNRHTWPVLVGEPDRRDVMLSSPIILYDHPQIAPESPGDLFDSTEIDEILTLRILTLTDQEKQEARATDARARRILERSEAIPQEIFQRLHGAVRSIGPAADAASVTADRVTAAPDPLHVLDTLDRLPVFGTPGAQHVPGEPDPVPVFGAPDSRPATPYWEPEARVPPDMASVTIAGCEVAKGSRVVLRPGPRGDSMDMFLRGMEARVEGVFESVDDETYVAVTVGNDPASDLHSWYGRYFYFRPSELEPLDSPMGSER
ncbi:MAG: hypothetical protein H0V12_06905 [Chloroflexi bacterium]|nr:hypothetical protein [Chloroflexota bacterium]